MKTLICNEQGFDIYFEAMEEHDTNFRDWDEDLKNETIKNLDSGKLIMFCAKVTAEKNGIALASDYLGACIYESEKHFYEMKDDYFVDMKSTVIKEAKEQIKSLAS